MSKARVPQRSRDWQGELSVVIPAFNEEGAIASTVTELRARLPRAEIVVVDDGSRDATCERAVGVAGVRVIRHSFNRGYGAALKTGMRFAKGRYVAWFDADNEHRVDDLEAMAKRLAEEELAAIIGRRTAPGPSMVRNYGKLAIRLITRSLGVDVGKDINCGLRVFRREFIGRYRALLPDTYSASLTSTMVLIERGYKFAFHDIVVKPRIGHSKVRIKHGFSTIALVLRMVMLFAPMRIFFFPGALLFVAGVAYGIARAIVVGQGVPALGVLVATTGFLSAMLGLVADQISQMRLGQLSERTEVEVEELTGGVPELPGPGEGAVAGAVAGAEIAAAAEEARDQLTT